MQDYTTSFGISLVAGMRSMTACAALTWAASVGRTRNGFIPSSPEIRTLATAAALAEMVGDKILFAPDRRIPPSVAARLAIGAVGGWALVRRRASPEHGALAGVAGAVAGTLIGRAARGPGGHAPYGLARGLAEDAVAAGVAFILAASADQGRSARRRSL
ncbi:hypothetical protein [Methylorubrum zatmanii]